MKPILVILDGHADWSVFMIQLTESTWHCSEPLNYIRKMTVILPIVYKVDRFW